MVVEDSKIEEVVTSQTERKSYWKILFRSSIQPAFLLLLLAAAIRHTGKMICY